MAISLNTKHQRIKRKARIRKRVSGTIERPRLAVFKSSKHIYAQVINDEIGCTLVAASTLDSELSSDKNENIKKSDEAKLVGALIAKRCLEKNIQKIVFDRSGYIYHGRIKALADSAREAGLKF